MHDEWCILTSTPLGKKNTKRHDSWNSRDEEFIEWIQNTPRGHDWKISKHQNTSNVYKYMLRSVYIYIIPVYILYIHISYPAKCRRIFPREHYRGCPEHFKISKYRPAVVWSSSQNSSRASAELAISCHTREKLLMKFTPHKMPTFVAVSPKTHTYGRTWYIWHHNSEIIINTSYQKLPFGSGDYPDKLLFHQALN